MCHINKGNKVGQRILNWHTASGAWQVASIAYTASKLLSGNGIFMKSACIIKKQQQSWIPSLQNMNHSILSWMLLYTSIETSMWWNKETKRQMHPKKFDNKNMSLVQDYYQPLQSYRSCPLLQCGLMPVGSQNILTSKASKNLSLLAVQAINKKETDYEYRKFRLFFF